MHFTD